jgi:hypothetical protein
MHACSIIDSELRNHISIDRGLYEADNVPYYLKMVQSIASSVVSFQIDEAIPDIRMFRPSRYIHSEVDETLMLSQASACRASAQGNSSRENHTIVDEESQLDATNNTLARKAMQTRNRSLNRVLDEATQPEPEPDTATQPELEPDTATRPEPEPDTATRPEPGTATRPEPVPEPDIATRPDTARQVDNETTHAMLPSQVSDIFNESEIARASKQRSKSYPIVHSKRRPPIVHSKRRLASSFIDMAAGVSTPTGNDDESEEGIDLIEGGGINDPTAAEREILPDAAILLPLLKARRYTTAEWAMQGMEFHRKYDTKTRDEAMCIHTMAREIRDHPWKQMKAHCDVDFLLVARRSTEHDEHFAVVLSKSANQHWITRNISMRYNKSNSPGLYAERFLKLENFEINKSTVGFRNEWGTFLLCYLIVCLYEEKKERIQNYNDNHFLWINMLPRSSRPSNASRYFVSRVGFCSPNDLEHPLLIPAPIRSGEPYPDDEKYYSPLLVFPLDEKHVLKCKATVDDMKDRMRLKSSAVKDCLIKGRLGGSDFTEETIELEAQGPVVEVEYVFEQEMEDDLENTEDDYEDDHEDDEEDEEASL